MGAPGALPPTDIIDRPIENYYETVHFVKFHTQDCMPNHFRLVLAVEKGSWSRAIRVCESSQNGTAPWKEIKVAGNNEATPFFPPSPSSLQWSEQFRFEAAWINMSNYSTLQLECWKDEGVPFFWTCIGGKKIKLPGEVNSYAGHTLVCFWLDDNSRIEQSNLKNVPYPAPAQLINTRPLILLSSSIYFDDRSLVGEDQQFSGIRQKKF
ncbi:hypothetical protein PPL_09141 [Heterostelium album PN500]|uniref:Uncharacterized protein n=1 Tax=Heterostelium pallidum (strain ATCC 26659 / Pp 5 / PN500) TaxID=670386 RepID=D3BKQ9_HETP5|nr:hypothetical protein PPL_09141 [Heterostelium album PN500]EFA78489.1 hypothetical protein PPL_09141 [Heterostelium album PN500]|eukprot:XP_020430613.1 hypothetical protein PPL_09141 [Heterostelium album PN500]